MTTHKNNNVAMTTSVVIALLCGAPLEAQEIENPAPEALTENVASREENRDIEEVIVTGRSVSATQELINERLDDAYATDLLGSEAITRLGDSTVGAALRRMPGLTLVQDKFVYIRGLGERYSQSTLNGAQIPSPDLTRNVIPLDIFPTSDVESLRVQKSWSPALSANFGGGAVDIRTKGIPDAMTLQFEVGLGQNSANPGSVYSYAGGGDDNLGTDDGTRALSPLIDAGITAFQGNPSVNSILSFLQREDSGADLHDAQTVNREMALALNRNISLTTENVEPDYGFRGNFGNRFEAGQDWEFGFNVAGSYRTDTLYRRTLTANYGEPEEQNGVRQETTNAVNIAGTVSLGAAFTADHELSTTSLFLRTTDDETEVFDFFNENRVKSGGRGFRDYRLQYEEREMVTNQISGSHYLGSDTRQRFPFLDKLLAHVPEETLFEWFFSDSEAQTDIPNQVKVTSETFTDRQSGEVLSESVRLTSSAADYRFTNLNDEVQHYGWSGSLPIDVGLSRFEFSGGWNHAQKSRTYEQLQLSLGFLSVADNSVLEGSLGDVFSDQNITATVPDPASPVPGAEIYVHNVVFDRQGTNSNSYLAATMTDAAWGQVDWNYNDRWRVAAGARWEDYRQAAVDWNPYGFSLADPQVTSDAETLALGVFQDDDIYPAVAITFMDDWLAETFQLRFGYSETAVRPDLREITDSSYIDPITGELVRGNPGVVPAGLQSYDLRAEWYFGNGDNFSATLFHKEIDNPIEFFEIPASDTTIAREIVNAESGTITGVELEFLKELGFMGQAFDTFFVQGNLTLQDTELVAGLEADNPTNPVRPLSGASDYIVNFMLGWDSPDAKHTASLIYNVFGERLYVAGRLGSPDGYEQPFNSLDFTYFWYPTDRMTFKLKARNLLGETMHITRADVTTFEEDPGTFLGLTFTWSY